MIAELQQFKADFEKQAKELFNHIAEAQMKEAAAKSTAGDKDGAIAMYRSVLDQKCLFPKRAKEAQKQLKALGVTDVGANIPPTPIFDRAQSAAIEAVMRRGLMAENRAQYPLASKLYAQAHRMDPADPTPLRREPPSRPRGADGA